ncbi:uncharacterized protein MONOS_2057 [Monocercomonoides exilis]|uniref:uncharacterized protein n=1 Tax=Monocercomonoides exilis TaxID=2049356 RepID=UPI0035595151|nr:hypothetical protein MONOS_2057 [Monocercomonoides exilis]|eukprot:MONOS_2057.1-p1 / transcript=MONOS_2057.1 / gene=MONOS_2057 / organism=Monocercomonoides_exilis_PA203 / gene_product=unspecified product / transcript_product=unspecified product / location=Mono_scaffold00040:70018-70619(-) / protein_length=129 / sequence_SO=supercontig / SO=protein_coding / is_pseudo=false
MAENRRMKDPPVDTMFISNMIRLTTAAIRSTESFAQLIPEDQNVILRQISEGFKSRALTEITAPRVIQTKVLPDVDLFNASILKRLQIEVCEERFLQRSIAHQKKLLKRQKKLYRKALLQCRSSESVQ